MESVNNFVKTLRTEVSWDKVKQQVPKYIPNLVRAIALIAFAYRPNLFIPWPGQKIHVRESFKDDLAAAVTGLWIGIELIMRDERRLASKLETKPKADPKADPKAQLQSQAKRLHAQLLLAIQQKDVFDHQGNLTKVGCHIDGYSRYSNASFSNVLMALLYYANYGNLSEKFTPMLALGVENDIQPDTVKDTFSYHLDLLPKDEYGRGIKSTIEAIDKHEFAFDATKTAAKLGREAVALMKEIMAAHGEVVPQNSKTEEQQNAKRLADSMKAIVDHNPNRMISSYRNSTPAFKNLIAALNAYYHDQSLWQKFESESSQGQGASEQPDTVLATFRNALDVNVHGGIQQTIKAINEQGNRAYEDDRSICQHGEKAVKLVKKILAKHEIQ